jgi:hypothetical protein
MNHSMLSEDEDGSQVGIDLLINSKRVASTDGSNRSFDMRHSTGDEGAHDISLSDSESGGGGGGGGRKGGKGGNRRKRVVEESSSFGGSDAGGGSDTGSEVSVPRPSRQEDILNAKRELLYQFARLEKKGIRVPKHYTMTSDLDEMKADFDRLKRDVEVDASVRFQRRMLMACVSGIEFLNNRFDPFDVHLDGWSETVQDGVNEYDDIFEELHEKYHGKMKMAPELRLMMTLGGSAVWFHMSHSMFKSTMPGIDQIFKQNPELKQQFMSATMKTMQGGGANTPSPSGPRSGQPQTRPTTPITPNNGAGSVGGGLFGHLGNMMGGMFGGGGGAGGGGGGGQQRPTGPAGPAGPTTPRTTSRPSMRGPSDVDDILSEINDERFSEMNDVLEIFSNASSDGGSSDIVSIDGDSAPQRRGRQGKRAPPRRRTLDLD